MTADQIKQEYHEKYGRPMEEKDYRAFVQMIEMVGATDCRTYQEGLDRILDAIRQLQADFMKESLWLN